MREHESNQNLTLNGFTKGLVYFAAVVAILEHILDIVTDTYTSSNFPFLLICIFLPTILLKDKYVKKDTGAGKELS